MSAAAIQCPDSTGNVGPSLSPLPSVDWTSRSSSEDTTPGNLRLERPYLRARRRVRQRVDAGEPRNSYSSIPGYSFKTGSGPAGLPLPGGLPAGAGVPGKHFFAVAAAAQARAAALAHYRMQGPFHGAGPPAPVQGRLPFFGDAFFRPHYPFVTAGPPETANGFPFPTHQHQHQHPHPLYQHHRHGFPPRPPFGPPEAFAPRPPPHFGQYPLGLGPLFSPRGPGDLGFRRPGGDPASAFDPEPESAEARPASPFCVAASDKTLGAASDVEGFCDVEAADDPEAGAAATPAQSRENLSDTSVSVSVSLASERVPSASTPTADRPATRGCDDDAPTERTEPTEPNGDGRSPPVGPLRPALQVDAARTTSPEASFATLSSTSEDATALTSLDKVRTPDPTSKHQSATPFDDRVASGSHPAPDPRGPSPRRAVFLRDLLHGKIALAAAAVARERQRQRQTQHRCDPFLPGCPAPPFVPFLPAGPFARQTPRPAFRGPLAPLAPPPHFGSMEAALLAKSGDYASAVRHNNNELKDVASFVSHLFKMRQEMALNMTLDGRSSASDRDECDQDLDHDRDRDQDRDLLLDDPRRKNNNNLEDDLDDEDEEEEELEAPVDLQTSSRRGRRRRSSRSDADLEGSEEPRSPSSDAGLSVSSSGKDASTKSARLEHIVSAMRSSPNPGGPGLPAPAVNGCKKRKLYQPVQHETRPASALGLGPTPDEADPKKRSRNDENADPDLDLDARRRRDKISATDLTNPLLHGGLGGLPPVAVPPNLSPALQAHYMEMARKFIQEQQDKMTKEAVAKEILNALDAATDVAERIAAISPELKGIADVVKTEISAKLAGIVDASVGKYLRASRQTQHHYQMAQHQHQHPQLSQHHYQQHQQQQQQQQQHPPPSHRNSLPFGKAFASSDDLPPPPALKQQGHAPSGRAPQVRDRSTPRVPGTAPMSMANTILASKVTTCLASTATTPTAPFAALPTLRPAPVSSEPRDGASPFGGSSPSLPDRRSHSHSHDEDELDDAASLNAGEQDEALSLVVTPKKRRHKVTDTRITPRALSRVLGADSPVDLQKPYVGSGGGLFGLGKLPSTSDVLASRAVPGLTSPRATLFPGLAPPPFLPTSVAIPNPSLADFAAFTSSFYSPPNPSVSAASLPSSTSHAAPVRDSGRKSLPSPLSPEKRHRHRSSESPLALLSRAGAGLDFAAQLREDRNKEVEEFAQSSLPYLSGFNMGEATSATLTPMHLRKAKLMFFWVRYPSSAILKMYFPDIKFNKNNTAQLVKWFSNFREFYYIQMEKYARQAISEGVKSDSELRVNEDSELYRVLNVHYNRNNHIEVPEHFLPVLNVTLREFFNSVQSGKDAESSWKKQIYKVIARYDEAIPEYFKTPEFLKQLE